MKASHFPAISARRLLSLLTDSQLMTEDEILRLVREIETMDIREHYEGSALFDRASSVRDIRVVRALALVHQGLSNKEANSAHALRNIIKAIDAPTFPLSWAIIDAEADANQIVRRLEDFTYAPWAVAYILGEIGGHGVLRGAALRLRAEHSARHYVIVRLTAHLLVRYLTIQANKPPTMTVIDVTTGAMTRGIPQPQDMYAQRRSQADELFVPIDPTVIQDLRRGVASVPDQILNLPREDFYLALEKVPKRRA